MTPSDRLRESASRWRVSIEHILDTESSLVATGMRGDEPVVLKVVKHENDEWHAGEILHAFGGRGMVRALEWTDGAMLLERLAPGVQLAETTLAGGDDAATDVLAEVIGSLSPAVPPAVCFWVDDLAGGFDRYVESGDGQISPTLVEQAHGLFVKLCESQRRPRLLHGDLHHFNVLSDRARGWVAIDPKGYIGELEYELGAAFRNPVTEPELLVRPDVIERRLARFAAALEIDTGRVLQWVLAQAVLSAIWDVEDGQRIDAGQHALRLADALRTMV